MNLELRNLPRPKLPPMPDRPVRRAVDPALNSEGRGLGHVGLGLLLVVGAIGASQLLAKFADDEFREQAGDPEERDHLPPVSAMWTPLFLAVTLSGLRVWNAPRGRERTRALAHWFGIQALNALWMYLGFGRRQRGAMAAEAAVTVLNAAAYANAARKVDRAASWFAAPCAAWVGFAALLSEELWRRNR